MPNDEVIDFVCPKCAKRLKAKAALAGRRVKCPKCLEQITLATSTPLATVPVASQDDDWLNLGAPAIADVTARQQVVEENKAAKERERTARRNKEQARRQSSPNVTAESLEAASRQRLLAESCRPVGDRAKNTEDDLPSLAPIDDSLPTIAKRPSTDTNSKRSIFDDDLPELAELQPSSNPTSSGGKLAVKHAGIDLSKLDELDALVPDLGATPARRPAPNAAGNKSRSGAAGAGSLSSLLDDLSQPANKSENKDPEYRIACTACGTAQYVRLSLKGSKIKCPDCFLEFKVPPPPLGWTGQKKPKLQLTNEDIPLSAAEELHHAQTLESQRSRASHILEKAQQQVTDDDLERLYDGDFDTAGFVQRTFGFLKDPVAVAHIIGFAIVFAMLFALGQFAANNLDSGFGRGVLLLATIGGPVIGLLFAMPMLSGGLALLESVANGQKKVTEWPGFNLFDNFGDIAAILSALLGSMVPGFLIGTYLGGDEPGAGRFQIAGMMFTTFAFFPVILLSMLDNGSVFAPLSNAVFRSFREAAEPWAGYYLKTFMAFSAVMLMWLLLLGKNEILAAIAGCFFPLLVFFTCQQIGALADGISDHLSFEFAPPNKDEESKQDGQESAAK